MTVLRVQVALQSATALPEDVAMNVWHFASFSTPTLDDATDIVTSLITFYDSIAEVISDTTMSGDAHVKVFDLLDDKPRTAILEDDFTYSTLGTSVPLPTECAITMSFQGAGISGANQRRRRGRLFLGPLTTDAITGTGGVVQVDSTTLAVIRAAATTMIGAGDPAHWQWIVFSPSNAGAEPWILTDLQNGSAVVDNGWTDNAFDTQRRRGTAPSLRDVFP